MIVFSDEWLYLDDGSDQGIAWRDNEFNDEDWLSGDSPLGYGVFGSRSPETVIGFGDDSNNKHPTAYFRNSFVIDDPLLVESLVMDLEVDDGAIVYINGTEVLRFRADGVGSYDDYASQIAGGADIAEVASQFVLRDNLSSVLGRDLMSSPLKCIRPMERAVTPGLIWRLVPISESLVCLMRTILYFRGSALS